MPKADKRPEASVTCVNSQQTNPSGSLTHNKTQSSISATSNTQIRPEQVSARLKQEAADINLLNFPNSAWFIRELFRNAIEA